MAPASLGVLEDGEVQLHTPYNGAEQHHDSGWVHPSIPPSRPTMAIGDCFVLMRPQLTVIFTTIAVVYSMVLVAGHTACPLHFLYLIDWCHKHPLNITPAGNFFFFSLVRPGVEFLPAGKFPPGASENQAGIQIPFLRPHAFCFLLFS
jgi:hypothetical protein